MSAKMFPNTPDEYQKEWKARGLPEKLDEVFESSYPNDEGFTPKELAERYKLTESQATYRANQLVKTGKLLAGWRLVNGHRQRVYRPA